MPPKAAYWSHFAVQGLTATCLLGGCNNPQVSLGRKDGAKNDKKRIGTTSITMHLKRNHPGQWASYEEIKNEKKQETAKIKKEEVESCEMENAEIRFFDIRTHGGRQPFLNKVLPDVAEPEVYWSDDDPRAIKAHQGILAQIVLDFQPFTIVHNKGFIIDKRMNMPQLKVHTPWYYADKLEKCYQKARQGIQRKLDEDCPDSIWLSLDGWSAETTSYIGAEIFYIHNWRRVKLVLGCTPFEERHTGEEMAKFIDTVCEAWNIRNKVKGVVSDTAANMRAMMNFLVDMGWSGCLNHIIQLVVNKDILGRKEISALLSSCKGLATAYHSSINFAKSIHDAQAEVMNRPEGELPWALLQEVSTRWNSQLICMKSILKSEAAIRHVLGTGEYKSLKSLAGVKLGQHQVELLRKVIKVLDPFYRATLQLSNDAACISEVIPIVTQLKEDLGAIGEDDYGVKTFKRELLAEMDRRMGRFEEEEQYSLACSLDPRYWMSCFSREESRVKARELLIQRIQEEMEDRQTGMPQRKTSSSSMSGEEESWEQLAKRRRIERQQEIREAAGRDKELSIENLVDSIIYSDLQATDCLKFWEKQEPALKAKGPVGEALLAVVKRYLTPPATSTAVERLFSAAGLVMEAKRNRLCPDKLDMLLFLREAFLLATCKLEWI